MIIMCMQCVFDTWRSETEGMVVSLAVLQNGSAGGHPEEQSNCHPSLDVKLGHLRNCASRGTLFPAAFCAFSGAPPAPTWTNSCRC